METSKDEEEPKFFEEKTETQVEEKPLVLTEEIRTEPKKTKSKSDKNLSPAVRKIVTENKIDISSVKGSGKDGRIFKR